MIKYKVSFEITEDESGLVPYISKEKWIERQKELIKSSIYVLEIECQGKDLMKVTDFKIEEVEEQ